MIDRVSKIPSRKFGRKLMAQLLNQGVKLEEASLNSLNMIYNKIQSDGISKMDIIDIGRPINNRVNKITGFGSSEWLDSHFKRYQNQLLKTLNQRQKQKGKDVNRKLDRLLGGKTMRNKAGVIHRATLQDGSMVNGQELERELMNHYKQIFEPYQRINQSVFPQFKVNEQLVKRAMSNVKIGKAVAWDCFPSDMFSIKCCSKKQHKCRTCLLKIQYAKSLCVRSFWESPNAGRHLNSRIIFLNKKFPNTPKIKQFRPIVIVSQICKFLEGLILDKLKKYCNQTMEDNQYGFRKGRSIQDCKAQLIKKAKELVRRHSGNSRVSRPRIFFADLTSAYDKVNRNLLYKILEQKRILVGWQLELIKFIHSNITISSGQHHTKIGRGTPQGLASSPFLFNIYIEGLLHRMKDRQIFCLAFADDVACIAENEMQIRKAITILQRWAQQHQMQINKSKSAVMILYKGQAGQQQNYKLLGYPHTDRYTYLGTQLTDQLSITGHLVKIQRSFIQTLVNWYPVLKQDRIKLNSSIFKQKVRTKYNMMSALVLVADRQEIETVAKHYRARARKFMRLPANLSNSLVNKLAGDITKILAVRNEVRQYKIAQRANNLMTDQNFIHGVKAKSDESVKFIPNSLLMAIRLKYGNSCREHRENLTESHLKNHNIECRIQAWLEQYQIARMRNEVRTRIKYLKKELLIIGTPLK